MRKTKKTIPVCQVNAEKLRYIPIHPDTFRYICIGMYRSFLAMCSTNWDYCFQFYFLRLPFPIEWSFSDTHDFTVEQTFHIWKRSATKLDHPQVNGMWHLRCVWNEFKNVFKQYFRSDHSFNYYKIKLFALSPRMLSIRVLVISRWPNQLYWGFCTSWFLWFFV